MSPISGIEKRLGRHMSEEEALVWRTPSESRGSDVRLSAGTLSKPDRATRQDTFSNLWRLETQFAAKWADVSEHVRTYQCQSHARKFSGAPPAVHVPQTHWQRFSQLVPRRFRHR